MPDSSLSKVSCCAWTQHTQMTKAVPVTSQAMLCSTQVVKLLCHHNQITCSSWHCMAPALWCCRCILQPSNQVQAGLVQLQQLDICNLSVASDFCHSHMLAQQQRTAWCWAALRDPAARRWRCLMQAAAIWLHRSGMKLPSVSAGKLGHFAGNASLA